MKSQKSRNGCSPEQNSKVLNTLVSGTAVAAAFMILTTNHKGKVVAASFSAPTPTPLSRNAKPNERPKFAVPERSTLDRIRDAVYARDKTPDITWAFIEQLIPAALNEECPSVAIAQAILETDRGQSFLAKQNNYFGIKCMKPLSSYSSEVHVLLAPPYRIRRRDNVEGSNDYYFVFTSPEACLEYRKMNLDRQRYQRQIDRIPNPKYFAQWAQAIAEGGWATDKGYADKLIGMIEKYELYLID